MQGDRRRADPRLSLARQAARPSVMTETAAPAVPDNGPGRTAVRADGPPANRSARPVWAMPVAIAVLALVLRLWAPGPVTQTQDEFSWLYLSDGFRTAVVHGDFARATAGDIRTVGKTFPTVPGVTTMWAGTLGYASVSVAHSIGLASKAPKPFSASVLRASRGFVALWCSIALGLLVALAGWLVGRRAAAVAGVLLATEPFLVGHSDVLHTDAMVTMFGALSIVALLAGLRAGRSHADEPADANEPVDIDRPAVVPGRARIPLIALSGTSFALATLTKLNAVPLVVAAAGLIVAIDALAIRRTEAGAAGWWKSPVRAYARLTGVWLLAAIAVTVLLWPALWVAPHDQFTLIRLSLNQLKRGQGITFFRQRLTADAGVTYYPVAMLFRMTPWLLFGGAIGSLAVLARSALSLRRKLASDPASVAAATFLVAVVPYTAAMTITSQKYDRYSLPLFPFLALACGVLVAAAVSWLGQRVRITRWVLPVGIALAALLAISTLREAPYAISYVDPLVGGQVRARRNILLGWGEGLEVLGAEVRDREGAHCKDTRIMAPTFFVVAFPCGRTVSFASAARDLSTIDYYVSYVSGEQRSLTAERDLFAKVRRSADLVKSVHIGGVDYAELWKIRSAQP